MEPRFKAAGIRIEAVVADIVGIADIKSCSRIWRPAEYELRPDVTAERRIIESQTSKSVSRKLVGRPRAKDVVIKGNEASIMSHQPTLIKIKLRLKGRCRLPSKRRLKRQLISRTGIETGFGQSGAE